MFKSDTIQYKTCHSTQMYLNMVRRLQVCSCQPVLEDVQTSMYVVLSFIWMCAACMTHKVGDIIRMRRQTSHTHERRLLQK